MGDSMVERSLDLEQEDPGSNPSSTLQQALRPGQVTKCPVLFMGTVVLVPALFIELLSEQRGRLFRILNRITI